MTSASKKLMASHGRGGAGNMACSSGDVTLVDLETPTLKMAMVTTGRGGTGNMARNECPHKTRLWQDVVGLPRRYSSSAQHVGRGGAGNIFHEEADDDESTLTAKSDGAGAKQPAMLRTRSATVTERVSKNKMRWLLFGGKRA